LLRSRAKPEDADEMKSVLSDLYLVSSRAPLEKILAGGPSASELHVYLGYSGWGYGQLDEEVRLGAWYVLDGSARLIFDPDPASLWSRLIARTEQRFALFPATAPKALSAIPAGGVSIRETLIFAISDAGSPPILIPRGCHPEECSDEGSAFALLFERRMQGE
ncbi:MAG: YqgE/AlgH family protein, partial [Acidobacteria bacterium]|nr:YqgE/AlgH family protein [Acidobacteriota bacterium]